MSGRSKDTSPDLEDFSIDFAKFGLEDAFDPFMFPTVHLATPCEETEENRGIKNAGEDCDSGQPSITGKDDTGIDAGSDAGSDDEETFVIPSALKALSSGYKPPVTQVPRGRYGIRSFKTRGPGFRWAPHQEPPQKPTESDASLKRSNGTGACISTTLTKVADLRPIVQKPKSFAAVSQKLEANIDETRRILVSNANKMDPVEGRRVYQNYLTLLKEYEIANHDVEEKRHCDVDAWRNFGWDGKFQRSFEFEIRNVIYNIGCYEFAVFKKEISIDRGGLFEVSLRSFKRKLASTYAIGYRKPDRVTFGDSEPDADDSLTTDRRFSDTENQRLRTTGTEFKRIAGIFDYIDRRCFFSSESPSEETDSTVCNSNRCKIYKYVGLISSMILSHLVASDSCAKSLTKSKFLLQHANLMYKNAVSWIATTLSLEASSFASLYFPLGCTEVKGWGGMEKWEALNPPQPVAWGFRTGPEKLQTWLRTLNVLRLIRYTECRFDEESVRGQKELVSSEIASVYDLASYYLYTERTVVGRLYTHVAECLRIFSDYGRMNGSSTHTLEIKKFTLEPYLRNMTPKFNDSNFIPIPDPFFFSSLVEKDLSAKKMQDTDKDRLVYDLMVVLGTMHVKKHGFPEAWRTTSCGKKFGHLSDQEILKFVETAKID